MKVRNKADKIAQKLSKREQTHTHPTHTHTNMREEVSVPDSQSRTLTVGLIELQKERTENL